MIVNPMNCDLKCNSCKLYPCGMVGDAENEVKKFTNTLNKDVNDILDGLSSIEFPNSDELLDVFADYLKAVPLTLTEMARLLGIPYNNDKERLAVLGLGVIGEVAWILNGGNNFYNYRRLYRANGRDYNRTKACLKGEYGNAFIVTSVPQLFRLQSPIPKHYTLEEVSTTLNYSVAQEEIFQIKEGELYVTYVYSEKFIGVNKSIKDSAAIEGITEAQVSVKLFAFNPNLNPGELKALRQLGLTEQQLSTLQGVSFNDESVQELVQEAITLASTQAISAGHLAKLKSLINQIVSLVGFAYYALDKGLLDLNVKNSDAEIETALQELFINGIKTDATDDELIAKMSEIQNIESGTHKISSEMLSKASDASTLRLLRLYKVQSNTESAKVESDTRPTAAELAEIGISLISENNTPTTPGTTFKSYDDGSSMVFRMVGYNATYQINVQYQKLVAKPGLTLLDRTYLETCKNTYNIAFKAITEANRQIAKFQKDLAAATSIGIALTGNGLYTDSFLKCALGIDANISWSPLQDTLNGLLDAYNELLNKIARTIEALINKIVCNLRCLRDLVGLGGQGLNLPICKVMLPLASIDPFVEVFSKYGPLLDQLMVNLLSSTNTVRFALFELNESTSSVAGGCSCNPLGGVFDAIKTALPLPASANIGAFGSLPVL